MGKAKSTDETLQKAFQLHQSGDLDQAERLYDAVLKKHPGNGDALNLKAIIVQARGRHDEAIALFERACKAVPNFADVPFNMANSLKALGRNDEALAAYDKTLQLNPGYAGARLNAGTLLQKLGRASEAIASFREMTKIAPTDPRGHYNLALAITEALDDTKNDDQRSAMITEAEQAFARAQTLNPNDANIPFAFANLRSKQGDHTNAIELTKTALKLNPNWPEAWGNLGSHLEANGDPASAEAAFDKALALNPESAGAIVNRGLAQLAQGNFNGWADYARRFETSHALYMKREWPWPKWDGSPLNGREIFLWSDQGIGDEILYGSMIAEVATTAKSCVVECAPRLVPLYRRSFPDIEVVAKTTAESTSLLKRTFDFQASVLDLGQWYRRTLGRFPNRPHWLSADNSLAASLREKYLDRAPGASRLIGISWRSANPMFGRQKSFDLQHFLPLFRVQGVSWLNVQYGDTAQDIERLQEYQGVTIIRDENIDSLADLDSFAAQLSTLDAVITVSNSTAHLAAALGVPVFLLLPEKKKKLWYWFGEGEFSPWYRSMRIKRGIFSDSIENISIILRNIK